ncbi:NAD-dependent epimerase dehydratase [Lacticaseibacillus nasuensis JCM 17158]|uniref:NAD-dependent epimerase dehydratase n=2 Tax=Lacticaseibacillus TaxID=2759736 RepID=A0A0R1JIA9_9LACO|nr:NAD-dependent epimerase dehydratase [Lacticaseibacillus nasuensis JCM 17158]
MKIMLIGATGSLGQVTRQALLVNTDAELVLVSRHASSLTIDPTREQAKSINVLDQAPLVKALAGVDAVFAALSGNIAAMARSIVGAMTVAGVSRLVFISSMGIYNEIPAQVGVQGNLTYNPLLRPYRDAADIVVASGLNYTVIRPGWFDNGSDDYEITREGEPFGGHDVSRRAIAKLAVATLTDARRYSQESIGINRPE